MIVQELEWNAFCPLIFTAKVKVQIRHSMLGNIPRNENAKYMSKVCLPLKTSERVLEVRKEGIYQV